MYTSGSHIGWISHCGYLMFIVYRFSGFNGRVYNNKVGYSLIDWVGDNLVQSIM